MEAGSRYGVRNSSAAECVSPENGRSLSAPPTAPDSALRKTVGRRADRAASRVRTRPKRSAVQISVAVATIQTNHTAAAVEWPPLRRWVLKAVVDEGSLRLAIKQGSAGPKRLPNGSN